MVCVKKHRTCTKTFFRLLWFVEMVSYLIRWVGRSLRLWYFIIPQFKEWDLFSQFQQTHNHRAKARREQMKMKMFSHKLLICKCHHFCHHHLRKWFAKEVVLLPLLYCRFYSWFVDIITINKILYAICATILLSSFTNWIKMCIWLPTLNYKMSFWIS